jgi:hypothetical protein
LFIERTQPLEFAVDGGSALDQRRLGHRALQEQFPATTKNR